VSFAGALSRLAGLKPGRHDRRSDLPENRARDTESGNPRRYWLWLHVAMMAVWIGLLLAIVAYVVVEGETAMAQLDELDLVATYSLSP
jgi:hypothetical protein